MMCLLRKYRVIWYSVVLLGAVLVCVLAKAVAEETLALQARRLASLFSPREYGQPPEWSGEAEEPLFSFAWVSDFHLDRGNRQLIAAALDYIDTELAPDFVVVTGDNCAFAGEDGFRLDGESTAAARQRFMKTLLEEHLDRPFYVIPGDNWPWAFDEVFGPKQYSFDYGGMHFVFLSIDRGCKGMRLEGLTVFEDATLDWLREDLANNKDKPSLLLMHEPIYPPTFLDADRVLGILDDAPQVLACLHGHLHVDMEVEKNGRRFLMCPALGRTNPPGMKLARVFQDRIVFRTLEYDANAGEFRFTPKWQRVVIPEPLAASMAKPAPADGKGRNLSDVPPRPFISDPGLSKRLPELLGKLQRFVFKDWPHSIGD